MTTGSPKSSSALTSEVNTLWPDNSAGLITPADARQTLLDIIESYRNLVDGTGPIQRSVTTSPIVVASTDSILNCNIAGAVANVALPQASTRAGAPLSFEDLGQATAHPITLVPFAGDTIFGANSGANYVLNMNLQGVTLVPFNDATNSGWKVS